MQQSPSILPLIFEVITYIFVIYGFAGISTLLILKRPNVNILTDVLYSGFILYLVFFVIMRWLQLPPAVLVFLLMTIVLIGYALLSRYVLKNVQCVKPLAIFTVIILLIYLGLSLIPIFVGLVDPKHYAMDMAWAMNSDWIKIYSSVLKGATENLAFLWMPYTRAATASLGWLNNLVGVSINLGTVQRHILLYSIFTFIQFWRINPNRLQKQRMIKRLEIVPFFLILAGAYYLESLILVGQLNVALGIFLLVSIVTEIIQLNQTDWSWPSSWRLCALTFLLLVSYTELILMLPLFAVVPLFWLKNIEIKTFFKTLVPLSLGIFPMFIVKFDIFFHYLLDQGKTAVTYWPLGRDFHANLFNVISSLIGGVSSEQYGFLAVPIIMALFIVLNIHFLRKITDSDRLQKISIAIRLFLLWFFITYFATLVSIAITRSPNQSYMLFKLSSWTSPLLAIVLFMTWLTIEKDSVLKYSKTLLLIIGSIALFSGFNSAKFLARFVNASPQPSSRFVFPLRTIELNEMEPPPLYNLDWVENLAPWNHIPLSSSLFSGFSSIETYGKDHLAWLISKTGTITVTVPRGESALFSTLINNWQTQGADTTIFLDGKSLFSSKIGNDPVSFSSPILGAGDHQFSINDYGILHTPDANDGRSLGLMFKNFHTILIP